MKVEYRIENTNGRYLIKDSKNRLLGNFGLREAAETSVKKYKLEDAKKKKPKMKKTLFYRVVHAKLTFADRHFYHKKDTIEYKSNHLKGLPNHKDMTPENRAYWKQVGREMKIYKVIETLVPVKGALK